MDLWAAAPQALVGGRAVPRGSRRGAQLCGASEREARARGKGKGGGGGRMLGKREADPARTGLSRFGPVGALQGHNSCWGRPCSRAGATLRDGSSEPSERGTAPPPAATKRPGKATPRPGAGAASSRNPLLVSRRAPRGPGAAAGREAPV